MIQSLLALKHNLVVHFLCQCYLSLYGHLSKYQAKKEITLRPPSSFSSAVSHVSLSAMTLIKTDQVLYPYTITIQINLSAFILHVSCMSSEGLYLCSEQMTNKNLSSSLWYLTACRPAGLRDVRRSSRGSVPVRVKRLTGSPNCPKQLPCAPSLYSIGILFFLCV
jgi:hypothetical protein